MNLLQGLGSDMCVLDLVLPYLRCNDLLSLARTGHAYQWLAYVAAQQRYACTDTLELCTHTHITCIGPSVGVLDHLTTVVLRECVALRELPVQFTLLQNLEYVEISYTPLCRLPREIGSLTKLVGLQVTHGALEVLPY